MGTFSLYGIISILSVFVRMFLLPNPFECFGAQAELYNWIAEPILHVIAYSLVGLVYCKGSFPAYGSFLYLLTYSMLVEILWIFGIFAFAWWWVLSLVVGIPFIIWLIPFLFSKIKSKNKNDMQKEKNKEIKK